MNDFEIVLLQLVAKGNGKWSWYDIGNRLPGPYLEKSSEMMTNLKHLAEMGYVLHETKPGEARDRWKLLSKGRCYLESRIDLKSERFDVGTDD